jgi:tetratricopeptide (TPR) repeat protein
MRLSVMILAATVAAWPVVAQNRATRAMELAVRAFEAGEFAVAQEAFIQAVEADPSNGRAWLGLADASRRVGAVADAEAALEKAIDLVREEPEMHRGLAMYFEDADEPERAAQHLAEYVRFLGYEAPSEALARVSRLHLAAGMATAAEQFARSALERGRRPESLAALGAALARIAPDGRGGAKPWRKPLRRTPTEEEHHWLRKGGWPWSTGRWADAAGVWSIGLRYFDKSPLLRFGHGVGPLLGAGLTAKRRSRRLLTAVRA